MAIIGLDATYLSIYGKGVSRYQYNLIKALAKFDKENLYYIFINKKNAVPELPQAKNLCYVKIHIPKRIIWDQFQLPLFIWKYKLDIYHSCLDTLPILHKANFLLFLFEIPDYRIGQAQKAGNNSLYARLSHKYNTLLFSFSLKKAKLIIVSSLSTKQDLMQEYGLEEKKIRLVYPGCDEYFCAAGAAEDLFETRNKYNAKSGYIMHISTTDPRDNTSAVLRAYHRASPELPVYKKLIICGNVERKRNGLNKLIAKLDLEDDVIFTGHLLGEDLSKLYQAADLYVDPSFYEGFGFQVIEAMACGVPVVTSNLTSLPEVVDNAGILVAPTDINGLASAIIKVLTDSGLRKAMQEKSLERAKFFSWDKTAQETLNIYNELL